MSQSYALVTGASSGIGESFARELARKGRSLVLVARSTQKLEALCKELEVAHPGIAVSGVSRDLSQPGAAAAVFAETTGRGLHVDLLINNAGFGIYDDFAESELDGHGEMVRLNIVALVEMAHFYLPPMRARRSGAVINVASTAAFFPLPFLATYAATKAFVLSFSQALFVENRPHGVLVTAVCPGATATNFFVVAKMQTFAQRIRLQGPHEVVREAMYALEHGHAVVVTGVANKLMAISSRFVPRVVLLRFAGPLFERMYRKTRKRVSKHLMS